MIHDIHIRNNLHDKIEKELSRIGILFRVFSRVKSEESLEKKINNIPGKYSVDGKKIQDIFGMRIALYFPDDTKITQSVLENIFEFNRASSTIDNPDHVSFEATRYNLVFNLPLELKEESVLCKNPLVDPTFEVQLRTILSEGWHEVEHDLRYKHKEDWRNHNDLERALNGIYASLETADWSMMKLFEELAFRHYKENEWEQMLRTKFRLRFSGELDSEIQDYFRANHSVVKDIFQIDRSRVMEKIIEKKISLPLKYDNLVHVVNFYFLNDDGLTCLAPAPIISHLKERE